MESGYKKNKPAEADGSSGLCSGQPERRESLNSSKTLLTCPKQNIWHPWKSQPAKGRSCFIPHSSQQNRARASRTWLSKKDEFLKLGVGSFCHLMPLNQEFALRLLWCELCSISRRETRSFSPRLEPRTAAITPQQSAEPLWICTDIPESRIGPPGLSRVALGNFLSLKGAGLAKAEFGLRFPFFFFLFFF